MADENGIWDGAFLQYLMQAPSTGSQLPLDEDVLKLYGSYLTQDNKLAGLNADMSWLLQNNRLAPGAFDPTPVYEPINVAGSQRLNQYRSGTPFQQYLAESIGGTVDPETGEMIPPASLTEIIGGLQQLYNNSLANPGADPVADQIVSSLPKFVMNTGEQGVDWNLVTQEANSLIDMSLKDDQWDGQTYDPVTGQPARVTYEDSAAMEKLRDLGYTTMPGQPFTQDQLASPDQLANEARWQQVYQNAAGASDEALSEYRKGARKASQTRAAMKQYQEGGLGKEILERQVRGKTPAEESTPLARVEAEKRRTEGGSKAVEVRKARGLGTPQEKRDAVAQAAMRGILGARQRSRQSAHDTASANARELMLASNDARDRVISAGANEAQRLYNERMRKKLAEELLARNIMPFTIESANRRVF